jgi:hypothetical protein
MRRRKFIPRARRAFAWAWALKTDRGWELCFWAEPHKSTLLRDGRPSPEAVPVRVRMTVVRASKKKRPQKKRRGGGQ